MRVTSFFCPSLLALMVACGEASPSVTAPSRVVITLGETAVIEGKPSAGPGGLSFRWSLEQKPDGSDPRLVGVAASRLLLTPDRAGTYRAALVVRRGALKSESAVTEVVVHPAAALAGSLRVRVIDADTREPLQGVSVAVDVDDLSGHTDEEGWVSFSSEALVPPRTVHVRSFSNTEHDHDDDATTRAVAWPRYRGATLAGFHTAEVEVPLQRTMRERVPVRGRVDSSLFDMIPEVEPFLSLDPGGPMSGQLRMVMIAPVPRGDLASIDPAMLFTRREASLPANLTSDDESLRSLAALFGLETPEGGFTHFETLAEPGRRTFFVLGGLVTTHLEGVRPSGPVDEVIARQGRFESALSYVGLVTLDVPETGLVLPAALGPSALDGLWKLPSSVERRTEDVTTPLHTGPVQVERVHLSGGREVRVNTPPPLADRRLETWNIGALRAKRRDAAGAPLEPTQWGWLSVPDETGPAESDVAWQVLVAAASTSTGTIPLGFALVRDSGFALDSTVFRLPEPRGPFEGARLEVAASAMRRLGIEGESRHVVEWIDQASLEPTFAVFPYEPSNRWNGLVNFNMGERADPTRLPFDKVRSVPAGAYVYAKGLPDGGLTLETPGARFVHTVLARDYFLKEEDGTRRTDVSPLWDIHQAAGATTTVPWPPLDALHLDDGSRLRVEAFASSSAAPASGRWTLDPVGIRRTASDAFLLDP